MRTTRRTSVRHHTARVLVGAAVAAGVLATGTAVALSSAPTTAAPATVAVRPPVASAVASPAASPTTLKPLAVVTARLSPGDGVEVGVGRPVAVTLSRRVTTAADRAALERRLHVMTSPAVVGAWRWMDDRTLHYRAERFWQPGTRVEVRADLAGLPLSGRVAGSGVRTTSFTVGRSLVSTVDVQAHTMTVREGGRVVRVMKASMGTPRTPTRNGTFLVLEKSAERVMDSATVDLPPGTPAYRTAVEDAVRITNSGTFTHGAPWSVADQGKRNVSHGCINLSPEDADWFFHQARKGDVVRVVGSTVGPNSWDAGSMDWNTDFATWRSGSALAR